MVKEVDAALTEMRKEPTCLSELIKEEWNPNLFIITDWTGLLAMLRIGEFMLYQSDSIRRYYNVDLPSDALYVTEVIVPTPHRRCGYGKRLLAELKSVFASRLHKIYFEVEHTNIIALNLYFDAGFRAIEHSDTRAAYLMNFKM